MASQPFAIIRTETTVSQAVLAVADRITLQGVTLPKNPLGWTSPSELQDLFSKAFFK